MLQKIFTAGLLYVETDLPCQLVKTAEFTFVAQTPVKEYTDRLTVQITRIIKQMSFDRHTVAIGNGRT